MAVMAEDGPTRARFSQALDDLALMFPAGSELSIRRKELYFQALRREGLSRESFVRGVEWLAQKRESTFFPAAGEIAAAAREAPRRPGGVARDRSSAEVVSLDDAREGRRLFQEQMERLGVKLGPGRSGLSLVDVIPLREGDDDGGSGAEALPAGGVPGGVGEG
jgi:hypothetical protein